MWLWDSKAYSTHYTKNDYEMRTEHHNVDELSVRHEPLVARDRIILPPLHVKLGIVKQFICYLFKKSPNCEGAKYLRQFFAGIVSDSHLVAGVLTGPEIRLLFNNDKVFCDKLTDVQLKAWKALKKVCDEFLGNYRAPEYRQLCADMVKAFGEMEVNMSLKVHYLDAHIDFFQENNGAMSDEQGERVHQDLAEVVRRFQSSTNDAMLAEYCWGLTRSPKSPFYKRQSKLTKKRMYFVK